MNPLVQKKLGVIVAAAAAVVVLIMVALNLGEAFDSRRRMLEQEQKKANDHKSKIARGNEARAKIHAWEKRSLPTNTELARSLYEKWLNGLIEQCGLDDAVVRSTDRMTSTVRRAGPYRKLGYTLSATGNLEQLVDFLYGYYSRGHLHKIQLLTLIPQPKDRTFKITCTLEALSLPGADRRETLTELPGGLLKPAGVDEYKKVILGRNLFGPLNHPPRLATLRGHTVYQGSSLSTKVTATDADKRDRLTFRLEQGAPQGASIDSGGNLRWRPGSSVTPGTYSMSITVADDGLPSRSDTKSLAVTVKPPLPPPPRRTVVVTRPPDPTLDEGKHTHLFGITESQGRPQVWLKVRTTNEVLDRFVGEAFQVGRFQARVAWIGEDRFEFEAYGKRYTLTVGERLADALPVVAVGR